MTQLNERELIALARQGDLSAFEQLLFLYERAVFNYLLRLVNHWQDAQDITQETFIKVYKSLAALDPDKSPKAWIFTIATHTAYDWLRKKQKSREFFVDDPETLETIQPDLSYEKVERSEESKQLKEALLRLKPLYRAVLLLYYQQELRYGEIAQALSLPLNTVKTYLRRAKQALKQELSVYE